MTKILLVDDEPSIRLYYSDVLADHGYEVLEARSGTDAMRLIKSLAPDMVVLDIKLDAESGLNVLQQIVRYDPNLPVMLLSAYVSFQDDYTCWLADSYVLKSGDPGEFLQEVARLVNQSERQATSEATYQPASGGAIKLSA
jgi:DNA-binding response OmpR family regulator